MKTLLRSPVPDDAQVAGTICHDAFKAIAEQHGFPPDFPSPEVAVGFFNSLLARPDVHGVIAEADGRVVGSNFLWESDSVAGVGPITVEPRQQNGAVGRKLMEAVLARAQQIGISAVRLVQAAYHARSLSLYAKLGFVAREPMVVMQGAALGLSIPGHAVRPARAPDRKAIDALCQRVHGHDRSGEAGYAVAQGSAMVVEHEGELMGYTTGIGFFGHAVAASTNAMKALIAAAPAFPGPGFLLPIRQAELFRWCLDHKLRVVMPTTLMTIGPYTEPKGAFLASILF